jgi:hypothetical protein
MNLGTQLKWFHDFWTSPQVTKIPQSLIQKLNYKSNSKLLKRENLLPDGPTAQPNCAQRAPAHVAQAIRSTAGEARALTKLQKSPRAKPKLPNLKSTITPSQPPCKNTPLKPVFTTRRSPTHLRTPARRWPALAGYAGQRKTSTAHLRGRHSPTERHATMGRWFGEQRRSRVTPPWQRQPAGSGAAVPVSYGQSKPNKVAYEHQ